MLAPSASASVSQGVVYGAGWGAQVQDDFGDEGPLDSSSHRHSYATALWQTILAADGFYTGAIDCDYGSGTTAATKAWQSAYGSVSDAGHLDADGSAGPLTMGTADQWLEDQGNNRDVVYVGANYNVTFRRVNGNYQVYDNGAWHNATYSTSSC